MEFNELMKQFAAKIGLAELTQEGDGVAIEIEGVPFGFLNEGESGTMIVIADIGKQPVLQASATSCGRKGLY